jgi:hypothetical protein
MDPIPTMRQQTVPGYWTKGQCPGRAPGPARDLPGVACEGAPSVNTASVGTMP